MATPRPPHPPYLRARTQRFALGFLLLAVCAPPAAAQQQPFTLERVLGAPFPSALTASPARSGAKLAWVLNERGARNVWIAEAPAHRGRRVTGYTEDDGQEVSALAFTPDGGAIVYVRGGSRNRQGEVPNPTSDPHGAEQAIWIVVLEGGGGGTGGDGSGGQAAVPRRLAEGTSPAVSPAGDRVAFIRGGQVWQVSVVGSEAPSQLAKTRGNASQLRFSPDGSKLAFVSDRGTHSVVGVHDLRERTLRFLDPSVDRDGNPLWSPDGARIAYVRIAATRQARIFGPARSGEPWSIRVADVATGLGREIWRAAEGMGSVFRGVVAENQLLWAAGDRIVFPWERSGWTHLYAVPAGGGAATGGGVAVELTPGAFEVEHVTLTADGREALYSSNQDDIDRRHIWRVGVAGGPPRAVTSGTGIEWAPVIADGGAIAFLRSDARRPAHAAISVGAGAPRELAPGTIPDDFPERALVTPQPVSFAAADGMTIRGQLFLPAAGRPGERHPAVIFFHGGSRRQMLLGWHYLGYYHNAYALNQYLASRGYVVLSVNYRSGTGYGMEFREALSYGATGASEFNDVLGAGLYLRGRPEVDPARIGLWGGSYGGYLTALGLARASDLFAAGVDFHGVHDWNVVIQNFARSYNPLERAEEARLARESSPIAFVGGWRSPVLLIHGDDDRNVPFSETVDLVEALRRQGVPFEQLVFPDEVHGFLRHSRWLEAYRAAAEFLDRRLARSGG